jgi:hypothetical protein
MIWMIEPVTLVLWTLMICAVWREQREPPRSDKGKGHSNELLRF